MRNSDFRCFFPLQCSKMKTSPKLWIAVIITSLISSGLSIDLHRSAEHLNSTIQICEPAIVFFSYRVTFMFYIFGLCLILSDAPFWDDNTIYYISRMSGRRWMNCIAKHVMLLSVLYAAFISVTGLLFAIVNISFQPAWSTTAHAIAYGNLRVGQGQGIYIPEVLIESTTPYIAFLLQFILIVLYGYFMGVLIADINIRMKSNNGFVLAVSLHALMLVISLDNLPLYRYFSLINFTSLAFQDSPSTYVLSLLVLIVIDLYISWHCARGIAKADIAPATHEWIS